MLVDGKLGWNSFFLRFVILQPKHSCLEIEKHFYNLHIQVRSIKFQDYLSNAIQNLCKYIFLKCFLHSPPCSSSVTLFFRISVYRSSQLLLSFLITVSNHQGSLYSFVKLLCHSCHGHSNFISRPKIHERSFILSPFPGTFHDIYQCNTVRVTNRNICTRF